MKELLGLLAGSRRALVAASALGATSGLGSAALIWLIGDALGGRFATRSRPALAFACAALATLLARVGFMAILGRLQQGAVLALRAELARRIASTPLRRLEEVGPARLQASLTADVFVLGEGLRFLPYFFINAAACVGCFAYLAWLSPPTFLAFVAFGAVGVATYWLPTRASANVLRRAREREDELFEHFRSLTGGLKELGLHARRRAAFLDERLGPAAADLRRLHVRAQDVFAATSSWGLLLFFVFIGLLLFALPALRPVDARTLAGFAFAVLYLQQPLSALLEVLPVLQQGGVALRKIRSLDLAPDAPPASLAPAGQGGKGAPPAAPFRGLRLRGVTHAYRREQEDERFSLGPIDLSLAPGQLVFLVGGNGSGKTTLAKLLTGLYAPESGVIELDGRPVTDATREAYRQHFAAVFSDFHLFDSLLGAPTDPATQALALRYLVRLHLDRKVRIENGRFSTTALSQGQRKRLALLAAYLDDRPVYVFDEWAADQDPTFKAVFYEDLLPELKRAGKAVFVVTHDDRYFHLADRVLRLELGALCEPNPTPPRPNPPQERPCPAPPAI